MFYRTPRILSVKNVAWKNYTGGGGGLVVKVWVFELDIPAKTGKRHSLLYAVKKQ